MNDGTKNSPIEFVARVEFCVVPLGKVVFLVTVLFGVAPYPEIVKAVVPTIPAPEDRIAENAG
jgi:hypothetical protein